MTTDRDGNRSNPYKPNPEQCCEACVFGAAKHAEWCQHGRPALFFHPYSEVGRYLKSHRFVPGMAIPVSDPRTCLDA